jgi:hypothetical protein
MLSGATLCGTILCGATLCGTMLRGATVRGTMLSGATVCGRVLCCATVCGTILCCATVCGRVLCCATVCSVFCGITFCDTTVVYVTGLLNTSPAVAMAVLVFSIECCCDISIVALGCDTPAGGLGASVGSPASMGIAGIGADVGVILIGGATDVDKRALETLGV